MIHQRGSKLSAIPTTLCALFAATLSACGGGDLGSSTGTDSLATGLTDSSSLAQLQAAGGNGRGKGKGLDLTPSAPVTAPAPAPAPVDAPAPAPAPIDAPAPAPVAAPAPAPAPANSLMPYIDTTKIPAPGASYSTARVKGASVSDPSQLPTPSDIGAFREACNFSHMSFEDPIVYPGQVGVSHLHTFFGNASMGAGSTVQSVATSGNSTCAGGTLNRTGYWVPTVIDTKDGTPIAPTSSLIYYKTGYLGVASASIKPLPAGLRMVAGNSKSAAAQNGVTRFVCVGGTADNVWKANIPSCPAGSQLVSDVQFPQCWDGVNLDSPDHKSHMAYANNGCPSSHPVPLPQIAFEIHYNVTDSTQTARWRLSSDNYDTTLPGGYSSHADWFMGWDQATMSTFVTKCINTSMDCHAYLLGDGTMVY